MAGTTDLERVASLAQCFFDAVASGAQALIEQCLSAAFTAWHNFDGITQTRAEHLQTLAWLSRSIKGMRFTDVHRSVHAEGFVQRHVLRGELHGQPFELPACIVGDVQDGLIVRTFEYVDSAQLAPLFQRAMSKEQHA